jgi:hypothetical protein
MNCTQNIGAVLVMLLMPLCGMARAGDKLEVVSVSPPSPAVLNSDEQVVIRVKYALESADAVRIFARPYTGGKKTPGYRAHPSPKYEKGSGEMEGWFRFISDANVDEIRVEMRSLEKKLLAEASMPVKLGWKVGEKGSTSKTDESKKKHTSK